jgi:hypothetical protein
MTALSNRMKAVAVAVTLALGAGGAQAAINPDNPGSFGAGTGNGELFVSIFRTVSGQPLSALIDTGVTASQLLDGTVADGTVVGNALSFFQSAPAGSFVFNGGAVANEGVVLRAGTIFTTNTTAANMTNLANNFNPGSAQAFNQQMGVLVGGRGPDFANNDDFFNIASGTQGSYDIPEWGNNVGGGTPFSTTATVAAGSTALALWAVVFNENGDGFISRQLGSLVANYETGNITFSTGSTAPVPLPAGVWLLGSALLGLTGIARRRSATAVAAA